MNMKTAEKNLTFTEYISMINFPYVVMSFPGHIDPVNTVKS